MVTGILMEGGGSLVESLTQDQEVADLSHQRPCVVSLSKTLYPLLSTGSTQENSSRHIIEKLLTGK